MSSQRLIRGMARIFSLLIMLPIMGACSSMKTVEWTEDVKLSDGRMIVVKRSEEYRRVMDAGAGFERGWLFHKSSIAADLPAPIQRGVTWEGFLKPLVLDILPDRTVYLVNVVATARGRNEWRVPDHEYYVCFTLAEDGWRRIPLSDLPLSVQPNLLGSTYTLFITQNARSGLHVDLKRKTELQSEGLLDSRYKMIVRLPAPRVKK